MEKTWIELLKDFEGMRLKEIRDNGTTYALIFDSGKGYYPSINYWKEETNEFV